MIRLTAREALAGSRRAAASLASLGVVPGSRVALSVPQSDSHSAATDQAMIIQIAWAAVRCGITPVMINPALPRAERELLIEDSDAALAITTPAQMVELLTGQSRSTPLDTGEFIARPMHYTSGTTGRPKGVWTGFLPAELLTAWWSDEQAQWGFDASDVTLVHGPLSSSAPLRHALLVLAAGGDVLLPGSFDPAVIAQSLADDRPTTAFTVSTHWQRLFNLPELPPSPYRLLAHAGSQCPPALKETIHRWAGAPNVWEFYGSTEGQFSACSGVEWEQRPGTLGRARQGRRLFSEDGIVWCETPTHSRFEYWRDPEKTSGAWRDTANGGIAFTVGDLGRVDADGYVFLDGRREDLIITGGMNVYPAQVEAALLSTPGISECAVFGLADEQWGQRVCAIVVGTATDGDIGESLSTRLAGYQRPKQIFRLPELPRNAMGKVERLKLPALLGLEPQLD